MLGKWHFLGKQGTKPFDLLKVTFNVSKKSVGSRDSRERLMLYLPTKAFQRYQTVMFFH